MRRFRTPLDISQLTSPQEPLVQLTVGNELMDLLIDTGATRSVLNTQLAKKSLTAVTVIGLTRQLQKQVFLQFLE